MQSDDDRLTTEFKDAMSIVANNDIQNHVCKTKAGEYARNTNQPLVWCRAHDVVHCKSELADENLRTKFLEWWQYTHNKCAYLFGALPLAIGMPVQITGDHPDREKRIMKGTIGKVVGWDFDNNDIVANKGNVFLKKMPKVIYVQFYEFMQEHEHRAEKKVAQWKINNLPPGVYPIKPISRNWEAPGGNQVIRTQFPLSPAYARTTYSMQGKTVDMGIMDLLFAPNTNPATGYVAFSRFKTADSVLILQPFDIEFFQQGVPFEPEFLLEYIR